MPPVADVHLFPGDICPVRGHCKAPRVKTHLAAGIRVVEQVCYGLQDHAVVFRQAGGGGRGVVEGARVGEEPGVEEALAGYGLAVEGGEGGLDGGPVPGKLGLLFLEEGEGGRGKEAVQGGVEPGEGEGGEKVLRGWEERVPGGVLGFGSVEGEVGGEEGLDFGSRGEGLFELGADGVEGAEGRGGDVEDALVWLGG